MTTSSAPPYELFYWPSIPGRGEFVRLALEDAGAPYVDVARRPATEGGGVPAMMALMKRNGAGPAPFAPPFLRAGELLLAQTTNILAYLGPRLGLAPRDDEGRAQVNQLALTVADLVSEVHDTHHPIGTGLYYEDQRAEALSRTGAFLKERLPKFLGYFERTLVHAGPGAEGLFGPSFTYVDLGIFHVLAGLDYAFPRAMKAQNAHIPALRAHAARVAERPRVAAYLASPRRLAFNENGIFRRYPELDLG